MALIEGLTLDWLFQFETWKFVVDTVAAIATVAAVIVAIKATRTAQRAVEIGERSLEIGQRAYLDFDVEVKKSRDELKKFNGVRVFIYLKNSGGTPAENCVLACACWAASNFDKNTINHEAMDETKFRAVGSGTRSTRAYPIQLNDKLLDVVHNRKMRLFIAMRAEYSDVFQNNERHGIEEIFEMTCGLPSSEIEKLENIRQAISMSSFKDADVHGFFDKMKKPAGVIQVEEPAQ